MDIEIENYMKTLNLDEICRTCLSECDEMISVYTEIEPTEEDEISYVYQILMNVASIQVMVGDGLPTLICKNCVESANNAFKFKILSERSEALLRTYLTQVGLKESLPIKTDEETSQYIDEVQYNENIEATIELDHNYIAESVNETDNIVESLEEAQITPTIKDQETTDIGANTNLMEDTDNEELVEHLDEEFQSDDQEKTNFKNLLQSKNFQTHIPQDVDLNSVKVEIFNSDDPSVQELIVKPDIPYEQFEDDSVNPLDLDEDVTVVASSEENIRLRERIKMKNLSIQTRVSKPRRKRNLHHSFRINENGEKIYMCTYCEKEYKHSTSLTVHIRSHTLELPYECKLCRKAFKQLTALTYHMRSHTGETPYKCTLCDKRYRQSASLTAHMRVHTGQRPFLCSVCGKGFRQAPDLGYHMRTHTKEKPYMCSICGKRMSMQCHLVQHMRTHTGEKPFSCKQCGKSFPSSTRLKRHEIIHTDLKPYECEVCNKSFNRASTLKVHVMTHSEERPHVCKICGKGFIQQHCLKSHLKTHCAFDDLLFMKSELQDER